MNIQFKRFDVKQTPDGFKFVRVYETGKRIDRILFETFWNDHKTRTQVTISKISTDSLDSYQELSRGQKVYDAICHLIEVEKLKRKIKNE